jgi:murein DD-endopeptidase MepM/ murein hydrolase activator NlpD
MSTRAIRHARLALAMLVPALAAGCGSSGNPLVPQLRPVEGGWVSSGFGQREEHPVLGHVEGRTHDGYDFAVTEGTPVKATMAGEVVYAGWRGGYGKTVVIEHADGFSTLYGHARELRASPGDKVEAGDVIAFVGSTGLSTGPHLHYELRKFGVAVDPGEFLPNEVSPLPRQATFTSPTMVGLPALPTGREPRALSREPRVTAKARAHTAATEPKDLLAWEGPARVERPAHTWE